MTKLNDLYTKATNEVAELMAQGYVIMPGDSSMGYKFRVTLVDSYEKPTNVISIRIEETWSVTTNSYIFMKLEFDYAGDSSYFESWARETTSEEWFKLGNLLYTQDEYEALYEEMMAKRQARRQARKTHAKSFEVGKLNITGFKQGKNIVTPILKADGTKWYDIENLKTGKKTSLKASV